ncbi:MAG: hypothetical protein AAB914_01820 [Patescibacteria group bacterium]
MTLSDESCWKEQGAGQVRSGVLQYKPDWFVVQTDKWIVCPWESHEPTAK